MFGRSITMLALAALGARPCVLRAQQPLTSAAPTASGSARQLGTVKMVTSNALTLTTDTGTQVNITVAPSARIVQLPPGSTDLKAAALITLGDIAVGDRVLVTGVAGDTPNALTAARVILMKGAAIAERRVAEQADWQKRGMGGIVTTADPGGIVTVSSGAKKIQVQTTPQTIFRRYASDSIKFEDAKPGTLAQIGTGDQLEVRGAKASDGTSIQAEEVVSGSFRNLSGTLASVNAAAGTVTLKDLTTKKLMTVTVTANSDLRKLPPEMAARFAARQRGADPAGGASPGFAGTRPAAPPASSPASPPQPPTPSSGAGAASGPGRPAGAFGGPGGPGGPGGGAGGYANAGSSGRPGGSAGMDLSKMLTRLPTSALADLHVGDAVMIVASQAQQGTDAVTAVTVLAGVEPILAATPSGGQTMTLSPWSVGGEAPSGGGGGQP